MNTYIIQWKSKVNGRAGRGTKQFEKEEAERLVEELNREYPQIIHQAVSASGAHEAETTAEVPAPDLQTPMLSVA